MGLLSSEIGLKQMVPMCRQLATAYDAGIPIVRAFDIVRENTRDRTARRVLENMRMELQQGNSLGEAARMQSRHLPNYFVELISAGEHGGRLDAMLRDLADYFEDRLAIAREVISAMTYPMMMLPLAWFFGTFALGIISRLDLTSGTQFSFESYFQWYVLLQLQALGVLILVGIGIVLLAWMGVWRWVWGWVTNFIWPLYPVTRRFALARFFRSMSLLINAGVPIKACVENSAAVTANAYIQRDLLRAVPWIQEGATLTQAFGESKFLTSTAREMIYVGEQSGNLDGTLRKVSEYHLAEAQQAVKIALQVFRQVLFLIVALVVGYIVISFYARYLGGVNDLLNSV